MIEWSLWHNIWNVVYTTYYYIKATKVGGRERETSLFSECHQISWGWHSERLGEGSPKLACLVSLSVFTVPNLPKAAVSCSSSLPTNVTFPSTRKFTGDSGKVLFILQLLLLFMVLSVWSCENWKTRHKVEELRLYNGAHQGGPIRSRPPQWTCTFHESSDPHSTILADAKVKKTNSIYLWP